MDTCLRIHSYKRGPGLKWLKHKRERKKKKLIYTHTEDMYDISFVLLQDKYDMYDISFALLQDKYDIYI